MGGGCLLGVAQELRRHLCSGLLSGSLGGAREYKGYERESDAYGRNKCSR